MVKDITRFLKLFLAKVVGSGNVQFVGQRIQNSMKIQTFWSALPDKKQSKPRVFETDKGFLICSISDETPDDAVERFKVALAGLADIYDKCQTQSEVYQLDKFTSRLLKAAGVFDS